MGHGADLIGARGEYDLATRAPGGVGGNVGDVPIDVDHRLLLGEDQLRGGLADRIQVEIRIGHLNQVDLMGVGGVDAVAVELHHRGRKVQRLVAGEVVGTGAPAAQGIAPELPRGVAEVGGDELVVLALGKVARGCHVGQRRVFLAARGG